MKRAALLSGLRKGAQLLTGVLGYGFALLLLLSAAAKIYFFKGSVEAATKGEAAVVGVAAFTALIPIAMTLIAAAAAAGATTGIARRLGPREVRR